MAGAVGRPGRCIRTPGCLRRGILLIALLLCTALLVGCATPTRAPVVSRDQPPRQIEQRPDFHRVKRGETLYAIAWRYGLDFRVLAYWNAITRPYTIYPGQRLRLSRPPAPRVAKARAPKPKSSKKSVAPVKKPPQKPNNKVASKPASKPVSKSPSKPPRSKLAWRWPARGKIAQRFSPRDKVRNGIKISGRLGQPVLASESGKVVYAGSGLIGYGRLVIIKHNKNYLSAYAHNRKLLVREGQEVTRGESIAEMGNNGNWPMLHFEIRRNGKPVDPLKLLPRQR